MKIIQLDDDCAVVQVNGTEYSFGIWQDSGEIIVDISFLKQFENFEEMNKCNQCEQGYYDAGEGDETLFLKCDCQPIIMI
ncbi:hypothetical protein UFOVP633_39 [uncultured Caudovirales phage]|jgi:hypothetical protein|uniref:Uncharacterized protein n=1 Tax=uncultured Caudovirales phage TaxID=2100421 RepID=A0A6J5N5X1_9CAUD|nr:hypothetical protein UFOVP633_39 [uncultured Caudovirales phage]